MRFEPTPIAGLWLIEPAPVADDRGLFVRTYCRQTFADRGLVDSFSQCSLSFNHRRGTLRGLHWQASPQAETKLVRCSQGAIWDVAVDLRRSSPTFGQWFAAELTADNRRMLYIPEGLAHGFQTLADRSEVHYQISVPYQAKLARGVRWDDPTLKIAWPLAVSMMSLRDAQLPSFCDLKEDPA